ncbi:MAG: hypothetical protein AB8B64_01320 [Granulosicoccus sp.]
MRRVFHRINDAYLSMLSGVAFYATLAIFPALAAIVSMYALLDDPSEIQMHLLAISAFLPIEFTQIFTTQLTELASREGQSLGVGLLSGTQDTTVGLDKPIGKRDAYVADHIGKSYID